MQERKQCEPLLRPRRALRSCGPDVPVKRLSAVSKSTLRDARLLCCPCALSSTCICIHLYECMCACICVYMHTWMCVCVCARARIVKFTKQGDKNTTAGAQDAQLVGRIGKNGWLAGSRHQLQQSHSAGTPKQVTAEAGSSSIVMTALREVLLLILINGAKTAAAASSCSIKSGEQLCCPVGMHTYGDGSACKAIGKTSCALWGNAALDICPTVVKTGRSAPANPSGWTHCANEYGTCICDGMVRFGHAASDTWSATQAASGSVSCRVSVFGDPKYDVVKTCQCRLQCGSEVTPAVENGDFELDPTSRFVYRVPKRWSGTHVVIIYRGRSWGNLRSGAGDHYVGLQTGSIGSDAKLSQTVTCLTPGVWYRLSVKAACRPGYGNKYEFGVEISGQSRRIFSQANGDFACSGFRQLDIEFKATCSNIHVYS